MYTVNVGSVHAQAGVEDLASWSQQPVCADGGAWEWSELRSVVINTSQHPQENPGLQLAWSVGRSEKSCRVWMCLAARRQPNVSDIPENLKDV